MGGEGGHCARPDDADHCAVNCEAPLSAATPTGVAPCSHAIICTVFSCPAGERTCETVRCRYPLPAAAPRAGQRLSVSFASPSLSYPVQSEPRCQVSFSRERCVSCLRVRECVCVSRVPGNIQPGNPHRCERQCFNCTSDARRARQNTGTTGGDGEQTGVQAQVETDCGFGWRQTCEQQQGTGHKQRGK